MSREWLSRAFNRAKPYFGVIFLQFGFAGMCLIAKFALNRGMSHYTLAVYRNIVATLVCAPFAFFFERKIRPKMTLSIFFKIILLGLLEPVIDQNLYFAGMQYTTATFTTAMCNVLPGITFLLAWILRLEKVNFRRLHSQAKILGTMVTIGGAMIMTLVKGFVIGLPWTQHKTKYESTTTNPQEPIKGALMVAAGCFCWACFYILQTVTLELYPAGLSLVTLICMAGALEGTLLTLIMERGNPSIWFIQWDVKLLAYVYSGIICSAAAYFVSGIIMEERGPVFVTAFNPLSMVIVAILGSIILAEQLTFGRILGAAVIVVGLYLVIWGKGKDQNSTVSPNSDQEAPIDQQKSTKNSTSKTSNNVNAEVSNAIAGGDSAV